MKDCFWGSKEPESQSPTVHDYASDSMGHSSTDFNVVDTSHNRIYFYSGVTRPKILQLNKYIFNLNINMLSKTGPLEYEPPPIKLHINSYGGSVFAGLAALDYIKNSKVPVYTIIDGCAASAATLMSCVGARMLCHIINRMIHRYLSTDFLCAYR